MSRDANGPFQLSGSIATASLKQRLLGQRAANQDAAVISTRKPAVVDLSKKLVAKTLSEKQFLRQRDRFRFAVLEGVLSDLIGLDVQVLWPQDFSRSALVAACGLHRGCSGRPDSTRCAGEFHAAAGEVSTTHPF